jgi:hypothetical protein
MSNMNVDDELPQLIIWHSQMGQKIWSGSWKCVEAIGVGWRYDHG